MRQIDHAVQLRPQIARPHPQIHRLGMPRSLHGEMSRQGAQPGKAQQMLERAAGRLLQRQGRLHARRIHVQAQPVVAAVLEPARHDDGIRILERAQPEIAIEGQGGRGSRQWRAQLQPLDLHAVRVDVRQRTAAAALAVADGRALDVQPRHLQGVDLDASFQQAQRRPGQRDVLRRQPGAVAVDELQFPERERAGKRTAELRELDGAGGQAIGQALDPAAPRLGVARHHDAGAQHHGHEHQDPQGPGRDSDGTPLQNACPRPM